MDAGREYPAFEKEIMKLRLFCGFIVKTLNLKAICRLSVVSLLCLARHWSWSNLHNGKILIKSPFVSNNGLFIL